MAAKRRARRGPGRPSGAEAATGREALLRAARALMTEKGLPRVTLREVAERAGVQPALVGYYFGGKDALLREVTAEVAAEMMGRIQESVSGEGSFEERLRRLVRGLVAAVSQDPYAPRLVVEQVLFADEATLDDFVDRFGRANAAALTALLESGRRRGETRAVEPMFFAPALIGMCVFFFLAAPVHQRIFGTERITPELARRFADHTVSLLLHGLVPAQAARSGA
jgi:AcrR family transcriptional regulator